jgi:hypothetical protein
MVGGSAAASSGMVLMNKAVLSSFGFNAPISMLLFQCVVCVVLVRLTAAAGWIRLEPFSLRIVRIWLPVNIIFVGKYPNCASFLHFTHCCRAILLTLWVFHLGAQLNTWECDMYLCSAVIGRMCIFVSSHL